MPSAALERHPAAACTALRGIDVAITREGKALRVLYVLEGDIARLRIPAPRAPRAAERLWQHTCCELFLASPARSSYREFNFSPSGEWAAYEFDGYRHGMRPLELAPCIAVRRLPERLELEASMPCAQKGPLLAALAAVVEDEAGLLSYWALRHPAGKPDFHHRDSFALRLE